jgi:hypothetical protein
LEKDVSEANAEAAEEAGAPNRLPPPKTFWFWKGIYESVSTLDFYG